MKNSLNNFFIIKLVSGTNQHENLMEDYNLDQLKTVSLRHVTKWTSQAGWHQKG